jgi:hypothetical protein
MATSLSRAPRPRHGACEFCGKPFEHSEAIRSDKQFCNSTCRSRHHKRVWSSDRVARARELQALVAGLWDERGDLTAPGRGSWVASVRTVEAKRLDRLASAKLNGKPDHLAAFEEISFTHGELVELFGPAVVRASLTPVPAGTCRTCLALADATVHHTKLPILDKAETVLLGAACPHCRGQRLDRANALVASARADVRLKRQRPRISPQTIATLRNTVHSGQRCLTCGTASAALDVLARDGMDAMLHGLVILARNPHSAKAWPKGLEAIDILADRTGDYRVMYAGPVVRS